MSCQYCGSGIPDGATTCSVCGMSTVVQPDLVAVAAAPFMPGPSFMPLDDQDIDFSGMPSWLQSFGESVAASAIMPRPDALQASSAAVSPEGEPSLPSWLEEPRAVPSGPPAALLDGEALNFDADSIFISEDDLPEWLRTIGDDQPNESALIGIVGGVSSNGVLRVPTISQVWVTSHQMVALAPGETLFARIAGEEIAPVSSIDAETPHHMEVPAASTTMRVADSVVEAPAQKPRNNMRVLLLAATIMVLILLVAIMLSQR